MKLIDYSKEKEKKKKRTEWLNGSRMVISI